MTTITVNGTSIQAAINLAQTTGDTVDVRGSGNYIGFQVPSGKKIDVIASGGAKVTGPPTGSTTGNVVELKGAGSKLKGFDVSGAKMQHGSGVSILGADITVESVVVHDSERGYGIRVYGAAAVRAHMLNVEAYHAAIGIFFDGGGADSLVENPIIHDTDRMLVNDPTPGNDTGGQAFGFKRNNGLVTIKNPTIDRAYSIKQPVLDPGEPASNDYGWDGAHFELYESGPVTIEGGVVRGSPIVVETGKSSTGLDCRDFTMRGTVIVGEWPGDIPADPNQAGLVRSNKGFLLRSAVNFTFEKLDISQMDWWIIGLVSGGAYGGALSGLRFLNNTVRLKPGVNRWVSVNAGVPLTAITTMEGNKVYHSGAVVAEVAGKGQTSDRAVFQGWTGLEGSSYWGLETAPDPCLAVKAERDTAIASLDTALGQLATANTALAAANARIAAAKAALG